MNRLAMVEDGILISEEFLVDHQLNLGDSVNMHVITDFGASVQANFTVVGVYEYFPTVYPDQSAVVGKLEYLFSYFGMIMPHRIWMNFEQEADRDAYLPHPVHTAFGAILRPHLEKVLVVDYWAQG